MKGENTSIGKLGVIGIAAMAVLVIVLIGFTIKTGLKTNRVIIPEPTNPLEGKVFPHLDHSAYFKDTITSPTELTKTCLKCHPNSAKEVMKTPHWTWLSGDVNRNGKNIKTGKRNQVNNFCISVVGNWKSCVTCHAGYNWSDQNYDFTKEENVDCLVCHDGSGTYSKSNYGLPHKSVDLKTVAASVRRPNRDNCGICHFNGGGGMGVKHGDLDESLLNANAELDIHIGKLNFQCIDCHETKHHAISGKLNTTYTEKTQVNRFDCVKCHNEKPHKEHRLNEHTARIACQTCHIPEFARKRPTKMTWDWSKAGSTTRKDNPHEYLKIKGEFHYEEEVVPTYAWYTGKMDRYITGDQLDKEEEHNINHPIGSRKDPNAKIWPFKVHHSNQPYDPVNNILIPPLTSGDGGYWTKFDWKYAIAKGAELNKLPYSGKYGFTKTKMYWPINHMVSTKNNALTCTQCHSPKGRINWQQLGYDHDPAQGAVKSKIK